LIDDLFMECTIPIGGPIGSGSKTTVGRREYAVRQMSRGGADQTAGWIRVTFVVLFLSLVRAIELD